MIYYIYSALDWFEIEAPDKETVLATCAMLGDYFGIIDDTNSTIKPAFSGNWWYNKTLKKNKAKLIDSVPSKDIKTCLLSLRPITESTMSRLIVSTAKEMAKGLD